MLHPRYQESCEIAALSGLTQQKLGRLIGVGQDQVSRFLNPYTDEYKPHTSEDVVAMRILTGLLRLWPTLSEGSVPVDGDLRRLLEAQFHPVRFSPVLGNDRGVISHRAAALIHAELSLRVTRYRHAVLLNAGGPVVQKVIEQMLPFKGRNVLSFPSPWHAVCAAPMNSAKRKDHPDRGAVQLSQKLEAEMGLSRRSLEETGDLPGVALLSFGTRHGLACELISSRRRRVPVDVAADFNFIPLSASGTEIQDPSLTAHLDHVRFVAQLQKLRMLLAKKTVVVVASDLPYDHGLDNPPTGSTKVHALRSVLAAGLADIVVLDATLGANLGLAT
jgi:hypothetical protein